MTLCNINAMAPSAITPWRSQDIENSSVHTYQNPVVPGFAPDPSVVLVDGTYFLVTSSFHLFPGIPIYASNDLKRWSHIGMRLSLRNGHC